MRPMEYIAAAFFVLGQADDYFFGVSAGILLGLGLLELYWLFKERKVGWP